MQMFSVFFLPIPSPLTPLEVAFCKRTFTPSFAPLPPAHISQGKHLKRSENVRQRRSSTVLARGVGARRPHEEPTKKRARECISNPLLYVLLPLMGMYSYKGNRFNNVQPPIQLIPFLLIPNLIGKKSFLLKQNADTFS